MGSCFMGKKKWGEELKERRGNWWWIRDGRGVCGVIYEEKLREKGRD